MLPTTLKSDFLSALGETGSVVEACRRVGVNRATAYNWRREPGFSQLWEEALLIRREALRDDLLFKADVATGRVVEEPLHDVETGELVLDDEFEPVTVRRLVDYDSQIFRAMLNKFVRSEDGVPSTSVSINNLIAVDAPSRPRLVTPDAIDVDEAAYEEVEDVDSCNA